MRHLLAGLVVLAAAGCRAEQDQSLAFEMAGIDRFWEVHDTLAGGNEPSPALWDSLWSTPGYAMLDQRERRRPALSNAMRYAFNPALKSARDSVLSAGGWTPRALLHLEQVAPLRDSLARFRRQLTERGWIDEGRSLAQRYLPPGTIDSLPPPPVSMLYFLDARGYSRLLIDPLHFMELRNPVAVLAHEFHHYYNGVLPSRYEDYGDDLLAWVLATTETEGIAGLLDKADIPAMTADQIVATYPDSSARAYWLMYSQEYHEPGPRLRQVESVLERAGRHRDSTAVLGRWLHGDLPDNGRILGAFMAATIERAFGRDSLVRLVGAPFDFWRAYGGAATRVGDAPAGLSEAALVTLGRVEAEHIKPGGARRP